MTWTAATVPAATWSAAAHGSDLHTELVMMTKIATERFARLTRGIAAYHAHPYRRALVDPPATLRAGGLRLLDYGDPARPNAQPLLIVPSLINRHYILDLQEHRSFVRFLTKAGFRPFVVAWEDFGPGARSATVDACVTGPLEAALALVREATGQNPILLGYCLGGILTMALAARRPRDISGLVFMATPWDFHAGGCRLAQSAPQALAIAEPLLQAMGALPVDAVQTLFYALDPFHVIDKFLDFAALDQASASATAFVALEDWLNDGLPLPAPITRTLLDEWYGDNRTANGDWQVAGAAVRPENVTHPSLVMVPMRDRIVPPASAQALAAALHGAETLLIDIGHIGMVSSRNAPGQVWNPLVKWMHQLSGTAV